MNPDKLAYWRTLAGQLRQAAAEAAAQERRGIAAQILEALSSGSAEDLEHALGLVHNFTIPTKKEEPTSHSRLSLSQTYGTPIISGQNFA